SRVSHELFSVCRRTIEREFPMLSGSAEGFVSIESPSAIGERRDAGAAVLDDQALLAALKNGEEWAFEAMVRLHGRRLLAVARRFTHNEQDAQDVLQSAYLSAFRALNDFEGACQLSTWLHRIVVNTALMRIRSRRRRPEEPIEALLPVFQDGGHHVEQFSDW